MALWTLPIAGLSLLLITLHGGAQPSGTDVQMQIVLEQRTGSGFRSVSPQHVFQTGDMVRFRVRSSADGFLYVGNRGASGKYSELFPKGNTGSRLEHGRDYRIPAESRSWFRIEKPAGYETVFFTFTGSPLQAKSNVAPRWPTPSAQEPSAELVPRCDDAMFRARGECLDASAGPSAMPSSPRDITIVPGPDISVIAPAAQGDAPIVYEIRIAHR